MSQNLGGKSFLTGDGIILLYYVLMMLTLITGLSLQVEMSSILFGLASIGAVVSRYVANKEAAAVVEQHCSWIFNTLWVALLLSSIVVIGGMFFLGSSGVVPPDASHINNFSELWADPVIRLSLQYIFVMGAIILLIACWALYRIVRGGSALIQKKPIKELKVKTL